MGLKTPSRVRIPHSPPLLDSIGFPRGITEKILTKWLTKQTCYCKIPLLFKAPVAQLDRAPGYELGGRRFESFRARHTRRKSRWETIGSFVLRTVCVWMRGVRSDRVCPRVRVAAAHACCQGVPGTWRHSARAQGCSAETRVGYDCSRYWPCNRGGEASSDACGAHPRGSPARRKRDHAPASLHVRTGCLASPCHAQASSASATASGFFIHAKWSASTPSAARSSAATRTSRLEVLPMR